MSRPITSIRWREASCPVKRTEVAVIAVLHDLAAAEAFADRMLVIHHGKQVICDVPEAALHPSVSYPVLAWPVFAWRIP